MNANFTAKTQALSLLGLIILNCSGSLLKTFILIVVIILSNTVQTQFSHAPCLSSHGKFTPIVPRQLIVPKLQIKGDKRLQDVLIVRVLVVSPR